ncbi:MAG: TonB-dependent receptor [Flavisolibacter sp.]
MYKIVLPAFFLFSIPLFAQKVIQGKVIDTISRQPLEAASVFELNANERTTTDQYGNFYLKSSGANATLVVSYVGYKPLTIEAKPGREIKIALEPNIISLKDITLQSGRTVSFNNISKIDLDLKPVRNTQELLRLVPGLFIAQHAGGGKAEQIFLRGFDCDHGTDVQVSVDGLPVNMVSHAHGQGYADAHFIIPETINKIDFGAGPYYTQQGNLNTAGYVNFSTYNNIDKSRIQLEGGRFDTYRALGMFDLLKKNKDKQSAYLAAEYYFTNGPTISPQKFHRFNAFGKYNLAISNNTQLTASLSSFTSKWNASGQVPERAVDNGLIDPFGSIDPTEGGNTQRHNINLIVAHHFDNGATWESQAFYSRYAFNLYSDFTFFLNDPIHGDEINQVEERNVYGFSSKFNKNYNLGSSALHAAYGTGIRYDATTDSKLAHVVKREFLNDIQLGDINEWNAFAFAQQKLSVGKWLFDGGLRFDYLHFNYFSKLSAAQLPSQGKAIISPKLNIQYTVNKQLQLYAKAGKGFHSNDTRVVVAQGGQEILPSAYGGDAGFIMKPNTNLLINIAAWYLYLNQEFVYVGDDGNVEPSGKTRRQGIDVILRYQFSSKLFVNANINFTKPRAINKPKGENYIPLAPTATSTGGLFYRQKLGWNGSLTYRYIKDRPGNEDNSIVAKGYFLLDGSLNYTKQKYEVGVAVENIFNAEWNEAQFATESRLRNEPAPVTELNFTPGTPIFARIKLAVFF